MIKPATFENAMKDLESIVQELERGDLPLDQAIQKFEQGVKIRKYCADLLDETEKKITILLQNPDGRVLETPFDPDTK